MSGGAGSSGERRRDFLAITGPTASGKTGLSLAVAEALGRPGRPPGAGEPPGAGGPGAEIVSMDSRQVYRGMDVGTAKATAEQRARVPHHGLDLVAPDERYSAGRFSREARRWIDGIRSRGRVPLLVGGTGFFLRTLTDPIFREPPMDRTRRRRLEERLEGLGRGELERWVRQLDPERAQAAVEGGVQRLTRTLEVALLTGRPLSWWHRNAPPEAVPLRGVVVVLEMPRALLDERIEARVRAMFDEGLVEEVRGLRDAGYGDDAPGMSGVGYREVLRVLDGEWTQEEAEDAIARSTRRYARRQLTWFRNQLPADGVIRLDATRPETELVPEIIEAWRVGAGIPADDEREEGEG